MLQTEELEKIARFKRLSLINAEKDYLQEAVLFALYSHVADELVFKGGTCLYKFFSLNRFSEDLDFTLNGNIKPEKVIEKILSDLELINIYGKVKEMSEFKEGINIKLLIKGPLYKGAKEKLCFIPINISSREKIVLEAAREYAVPIYKELSRYDLFIMQKDEILAEKIRAIVTRDKPRDMYDAWFLLQKGIKTDIDLINKKLSLYNKEFNKKEFIKSLDRKKSPWNTDLKNIISSDLPDFGKIKKEIMQKIKFDI